MGRPHPAAAEPHGAIVDPVDAQTLEPFDGADDVDERVDRSDLVQRHLLRRHAVHAALRLAQQPERAHGALAHPGRQRRPLDRGDQVADVAVGPVGSIRVRAIPVAVMVVVAVMVMRDGPRGPTPPDAPARRPAGPRRPWWPARRSARPRLISTVTSGAPSRAGRPRSQSAGAPAATSAPRSMSPLIPAAGSRMAKRPSAIDL